MSTHSSMLMLVLEVCAVGHAMLHLNRHISISRRHLFMRLHIFMIRRKKFLCFQFPSIRKICIEPLKNIGAVFLFAFKVLLKQKLFASSLLCCSIFTLDSNDSTESLVHTSYRNSVCPCVLVSATTWYRSKPM